MQRLVQIDNLRTKDPIILQIELAEAVRKPIPAIEIGTLLDMVALSEVEGLPKRLSKMLTTFVGRVENEIVDLPESTFRQLAQDLTDIAPERVCASFRKIIQVECDRDGRSDAGRGRLETLLEAWQPVDPELIEVSSAAPKIQRAGEMGTREKRIGGVVEAPKARTRRASTAARKVSAPAGDPERDSYVRQQILERLANKDSGLKEMVLVAGVRHHAKASYPRLLPNDVLTVLKRMKETEAIKFSAGRWFIEKRW